MGNEALTIFKKLQQIRRGYLLSDLRSSNERQFVLEMCEGLRGVPETITDEDITEYMTKNQIQWIADIYEYLHG